MIENFNEESQYFDISKYLVILKRHWLPASGISIVVFVLSGLSLFLETPLYRANAKLLVKQQDPTASITGVGEEIGQVDNLVGSPLTTESEKMLAVPIIEEVVKQNQLRSGNNTELTNNEYERFRRNFSIQALAGTDILEVSYVGTDPQKVASAVNNLVEIYLEKNQELTRSQTSTGKEFIENQLPELEANLIKAEENLRRFKNDNQIVDLTAETTSKLSALSQQQQQISQAQIALAETNTQIQAIEKQLEMYVKESVTATIITQNPGIQGVLGELQQTEAQLKVNRTIFTEENPVIIDLKNKRQALQELLNERLAAIGVPSSGQSQSKNSQQFGQLQQDLTSQLVQLEIKRLGLLSQIKALSQKKVDNETKLTIIPQLKQKERELESRLQIAQSSYTSLLQKLEEIRIEENQNLVNVSLMSKALVPERPFSPNRNQYITRSFLFAIVSGFLTIIALEAIDKSIKTAEQAKNLFGYPILGLIPFVNKSYTHFTLKQPTPQIVVRENPNSFISQSYQVLFTNLKLKHSDSQNKFIVVTSSVPREGTSTVVANLAMAINQLGLKVLIVDWNFRHASQYKIWDVEENMTLDDTTENKIDPRKAIVEVEKELDLFRPGSIDENNKMKARHLQIKTFLKDISHDYDYILVDTPPLNLFVDAVNIASIADGVLLVARTELLDYENANLAKYILQQSEQKVLGMVINGKVSPKESHNYYYQLETNQLEINK